MKKNSIVMFLTLAFYTSLFAQQKEHFHFGFYGGINYSRFTDVPNMIERRTQKGLLGLNGGVIGQYNLNSKWAINLMTGLNSKGSKWDGSNKAGWQLYYLSVVPQISYNFKSFFAELGPDIAFNIAENLQQPNGKWIKPVLPFMDKTDLALQLGFGKKINNHSSIVLRASNSLTNIVDLNITDEQGALTGEQGFIKNLVFQLAYQHFIF